MRTVPLPLRQVIRIGELVEADVTPQPLALGSFWAESSRDLQSRIVKFFKRPAPPLSENRIAQALTEAYADMLADKLGVWRPDCLVRVLAGREDKPDPSTPLSWLVSLVGAKLRVPVFEPFYRTDSRKSMRDNPRLSGPDALKPRIEHVVQDLCLLPRPIPGRVALIDDIYNLGASARVYSYALKKLCQSDEVLSVNLAATRFHGGKDGWGYLMLDTNRLLELMRPYLPGSQRTQAEMVVVTGSAIHVPGCDQVENAAKLPRFLAPNDAVPCPVCHPQPKREGWLKRVFG